MFNEKKIILKRITIYKGHNIKFSNGNEENLIIRSYIVNIFCMLL